MSIGLTLEKGLLAQLSSYLVASVLGTAAHYLVLLLLVQVAALDPVIASTGGATVGAAIIYALSYFVVFKSDRSHHVALARFALVAALGIVLNGTILKLLTTISSWHYLLLQAATTVAVFVSNFSLNRCWTFAAAQRARRAPLEAP